MAEPKSPKNAHRNAELIISRLTDYLSIRFDHAVRINSKLGEIKEDLIFHEIANVRRCLNGQKIFGPQRLIVADILLSDDDRKRRDLMSPTDQASIQVELVSHVHDEGDRHMGQTRGQIKIHDLKTYYACIDPLLTDFLDLVETWIWWDILDAAEQVRFEQKLGMINMIQQGKLSAEMRKRYSLLIHPPAEDIEHHTEATTEEILNYELEKLSAIRTNWENRRGYEQGHMFVLKREEESRPNEESSIRLIAQKGAEFLAIEQQDPLTDETREQYAQHLGIPAEKVDRQLVLDSLERELLELEREMLESASEHKKLSAPYNYKARQLDQMNRWVRDLRKQLQSEAAPAPEA